MKTLFGITLGTLLLAGCGPTAPPIPEISPASPALQPPQISALIGYRTALELTSAQVVTLDSINEATRLQNTALFARLRERPAAPVDTTSEAAPQAILAKIRANNRTAAEAVGTALSDSQRTRACELFQRSREARAQGARERPTRRSRGELADSLVMPVSRWPWCGSSSTPAPVDTLR